MDCKVGGFLESVVEFIVRSTGRIHTSVSRALERAHGKGRTRRPCKLKHSLILLPRAAHGLITSFHSTHIFNLESCFWEWC